MWGGGGGSPTPTPAPTPTLDSELLSSSLIEITDTNAQDDILGEAIYFLEFLNDISNNIIASVLVSAIANNSSLESLSTTSCQYSLIDNDNSNTITSGDVIDINFVNCPSNQDLLNAVFNGAVQINITVATDNPSVIVSSMDFNGVTFALNDSDVTVTIIGIINSRIENPRGTQTQDLLSEYSTPQEGAIQFSTSDGETYILVEPLYRSLIPFPGPQTILKLGIKTVADSTIGGTYNCPNSSIRYEGGAFPQSGTLLGCEGSSNTFTSLDVLSSGSSLATLTINNNETSVLWDSFVELALRRAFGIQ